MEYGVRIKGPGELDLRPGSVIRNRARIFVGEGARLTMHQGASLGSEAIVNVTAGLTVGAGTRVSWRCQILDSDFHAVIDQDGRVKPLTRPIEIGDDVLIGTGCILLKGVRIGSNSIIGAGSVVAGTRDPIPPGSLVSGNPATIREQIAGWVP